MNKPLLSIAAALCVASPALAQSTSPAAPPAPTMAAPPSNTSNPTPPTTMSPSPSTAPNSATSSTSTGAVGSSEAPGNVISSPVEQNRLDPSAPSPERLQIDPTVSGSTVVNPGTTSSNPGAPGQSYNAIIEGAAPNSGTSTGTSGLGVSPGPSPSLYPQRLTTPPTPNAASTYPAPIVNSSTPLNSGVGTGLGSTGIGATGLGSLGLRSPSTGLGMSGGMGSHGMSHGMTSGGHAGGGGHH